MSTHSFEPARATVAPTSDETSTSAPQSSSMAPVPLRTDAGVSSSTSSPGSTRPSALPTGRVRLRPGAEIEVYRGDRWVYLTLARDAEVEVEVEDREPLPNTPGHEPRYRVEGTDGTWYAVTLGDLLPKPPTRTPGPALLPQRGPEPVRAPQQERGDESAEESGYEADDESEGLYGPEGPTIHDVRQGQLGDCYLLAAIAGIVQRDPGLIYRMLRESDDTIEVLLWKVVGQGPSRSYDALLVPPPILGLRDMLNSAAALLSQGALWVQCIELAYLRGGFTAGDPKRKVESRARGADMMISHLDNGSADYALEALLGEQARHLDVSSGAGEASTHDTGMPWGNRRTVGGDRALGLDLSTEPLRNEWEAWRASPQGDAFRAALTKIGSEEAAGAGAVRAETVIELLGRHGVGTTLIAALRRSVLAAYPSAPGMARYTPVQDDLWQRIQDALDAGQVVTTSSRQQPGPKVEKPQPGHREGVAQGLVAAHIYTVLSHRVDRGGRRFVRLRNPWGRYGREYTTTSLGRLLPRESESAEFEIELADFTQHFGAVDIGGARREPSPVSATPPGPGSSSPSTGPPGPSAPPPSTSLSSSPPPTPPP